MFQNLQFRRQFLLTKKPIDQIDGWNCVKIDQYYLYVHPDLEINSIHDSEKTIILTGELYDSEQPEKLNADILKDILASAHNFESFVKSTRKYAGTFAFLFKDDWDFVILNDARALREIYYCTEENQVVCGSQPNIIARFSNPKVKASSDPLLIDFYRNHLQDSKWIGDETYFEGIKHLLPNHYLDINKRQAIRFWPKGAINRVSLDEAVSRGSLFLRGIMKAIVNRHPSMMAITGGIDSRTLLAVSRGIQDKIYLFVNNVGLGYKHPDIYLPERICKSIDVPFHVHEIPKDVNNDFRKMFLENTFLASEHYLPPIYHVFYKKHSEKRCILGVSEIARSFYGKEPWKLDGYRMAYLQDYQKCRYVIEQCELILADILPVAREAELNVLDLYYWEQRLGNWGAVRNSESLIAIEKVDPFNSHQLNEVFLGVVDSEKRKKILFREIIRNMWPELLKWPINPPNNMHGKITQFLTKMGVFGHGRLTELRYQIRYHKFLREVRSNDCQKTM